MARFSGIDDGGPCRCEAEPWVLNVDSAEYPTCPLERDHAISGLDGRSSREPDRIFGNNPGL